jgi:abortive infection bacteriophage resistance protein
MATFSGVLPFMCKAIDKELTSSSFSGDNRNNTTGPSSLCVRVGFPFMGTSAPFSNPYDKPYKSVAEQIALLLSRGMTIADIPAATTYLERMGYYRLSGYWYPFRKSHILRHGLTGQPILHPVTGKEQVIVEDDFRPGTTFEQVTHLYVFDRQLRLLFLDAIERVEVALRVDIAHLLGSRHRFAHRDPLQLHDDFTKKRSPRTGHTHFEDWLQRSEAAFQRSTDEFIKHFKNKYTGRPPVWIEAELWDFGLLSWLLSGLKVADRQVLAHRHRLARPHLLVASIRNINNVRNVCAHHGRLWNRSLGDLSPIPRPREIPLLDHLLAYPNPQHIYSTAAFLQFLLRGIDPATDWGGRLRAHVATFISTAHTNIAQAGFPSGWEELPLWN